MPRPYFQTEGVACFAHRGGAAHWPENTLESFRGGFAAGCGWLETDVHMTRDGHIVCFHDHDLRRTTNGRGMIWDLSLAELRRLDAGYNFSPDGRSFPFRGQGVVVPTLEEVLAIDPEVRVNIEIKQRRPDMIAALWRFIDDHRVHDRILVASEQDDLLRAFRNLARGAVATSAGKLEIFGFWLAARLGLSDRLAIEYEALQVPIAHHGLQVIDEGFVRAAHRRGLQVQVWTIDELEQMRWLINLGVDAIMTDQPERLAALVRERGLQAKLAGTPASGAPGAGRHLRGL
ncbi:MAG: glycerophosphodiester phosphodiesterase [Myxococcales bacterium]|nr:glycerophosphodiester phosphodiesterase [Myxococcales bacterium]